jgi:hypothetical protein
VPTRSTGELWHLLPASPTGPRSQFSIPHLAASAASIDHGFSVAVALALHQVDLHRLERPAACAIKRRGKRVADLLNLLRKGSRMRHRLIPKYEEEPIARCRHINGEIAVKA